MADSSAAPDTEAAAGGARGSRDPAPVPPDTADAPRRTPLPPPPPPGDPSDTARGPVSDTNRTPPDTPKGGRIPPEPRRGAQRASERRENGGTPRLRVRRKLGGKLRRSTKTFDHVPTSAELVAADPGFVRRFPPGRFQVVDSTGQSPGSVEITEFDLMAARTTELPRIEGRLEVAEQQLGDLRAVADAAKGAIADAKLLLQTGHLRAAIDLLVRADGTGVPVPFDMERVLAEERARDEALEALSSGSRRAVDRLTDVIAQIVAAADDGPRLRALVAVIVGEMPEIRERAEQVREELAAASGQGLADL